VKLRPGSIPWFFKHEVLLFWYSSAATITKGGGPGRRLDKSGIITFSVVWLLIHAVAVVVLYKLPGTGDAYPPQLLLPVAIAILTVFMFMVSQGLKASVEALFDRGDMDLLLSSPAPSLSIFAVRLLGITAGVAALYLFLFAPFAHAGLLFGKFRWLSLYPAIVGLAALATSLSMLLTLALVRLLGTRRTRVVAQVLGALAGAALFLLSQAYMLVSESGKEAAMNWLRVELGRDGLLGRDSAVWLPARAALGDAGPLLLMALLAAAAVFLTVRFTHQFFVYGVRQAASSVRSPARPAKPVRYRFRSGLFKVTVTKEWRLILRDPHLISQILLQLLYLIPAAAVVFTTRDIALPVVGAVLTLLCATLAASLAWLTVHAEDAPDLLAASPANRQTLQLAKLAAAAVPPLVIVALPLLWVMAKDPLAGLLLSVPVVGAVLASVLIAQWRRRPSPRGDFAKRGVNDWTSNILELINNFAWGGIAFLLLRTGIGSEGGTLLPLCLAFAAALAVLSFAWFTRRT